MKDLYELLQVHPNASVEVIQKAYHTLMQKIHPDRGGDHEMAKLLNHAYATLCNPDKRNQYDRLRQKDNKQALQKVPTRKLTGSYRTPILFGANVIVADERGNRILAISEQGDIIWEYGKGNGEKLSAPRIAHFLPNRHILIVDTGNQRVMEITPQKEQIWSYGYNDVSGDMRVHYQPRFVSPTQAGNMLVTDTGNRCIVEVDRSGKTLWKYDGKIKFDLKLSNLLLNKNIFMPVTATELNNRHILVTDQGNGKVIEVDREGRLHWFYPNSRSEHLQGLNFAIRLNNGHTWIVSDKILEVNQAGDIVWRYNQLSDADIKQAYWLEDGSFIIDFVRLVRRGVNQEVMMLNQKNKILWRHYYSQYRCI